MTMIDESVQHALDTVPLHVIVDVDRAIAPLVEALNTWPGIRTFASCAGHRRSAHERRAYVLLSAPENGLRALEACLDPIDNWRLERQNGSAYLWVEPGHLAEVAAVIRFNATLRTTNSG